MEQQISMKQQARLMLLTFLCGMGLTVSASAESLFSWDKFSDATVRAATAPSTWAPLAAAAVVSVGDWDHQWQRSASKHQNLFGGDAEDTSNALVTASTVLYGVSTLAAAPAGQSFQDSLGWKARSAVVMLADKALVDEIVGEWKEASGRDRPDGIVDDSFPSKHNATAAVQNTLTRRNLDYIDMHPTLRTVAKVSLYGLDGLTGIARMEADKHYPTDVLVGMALGNFIANLSYNLFLESETPQSSYSVAFVPTADSFMVTTQFVF